jgi:TonB family protein
MMLLALVCISILAFSCAAKKTSSTPLGLKSGLAYDSTGFRLGLQGLNEPDSSGFVGVEERPVMLDSPSPYYPEAARVAKIEGSVWVKVLVGQDGLVKAAVIAKEAEEKVGFEVSALAAAKGAHWKPAMNRSRPVALWVTYEIRFMLKD